MSEHPDLGAESQYSAAHTIADVSALAAEAPVRFLLVSGHIDRGDWGVVGAFWLSIDEERGGFVLNPAALRQGTEVAGDYRAALRAGSTPERIYGHWASRVGAYTDLMIDPQQHADSLLAVYRRVGTL
jgi:hypothetical protein